MDLVIADCTVDCNMEWITSLSVFRFRTLLCSTAFSCSTMGHVEFPPSSLAPSQSSRGIEELCREEIRSLEGSDGVFALFE